MARLGVCILLVTLLTIVKSESEPDSYNSGMYDPKKHHGADYDPGSYKHDDNPYEHNVPPYKHNVPPYEHNDPPYKHNVPPYEHNVPPYKHNVPPYEHNVPPYEHNVPPYKHVVGATGGAGGINGYGSGGGKGHDGPQGPGGYTGLTGPSGPTGPFGPNPDNIKEVIGALVNKYIGEDYFTNHACENPVKKLQIDAEVAVKCRYLSPNFNSSEFISVYPPRPLTNSDQLGSYFSLKGEVANTAKILKTKKLAYELIIQVVGI